MRRAAGETEWLDRGGWPRDTAEDNLEEIARLLAWLGAGRRARRFLRRAAPDARGLRVLDVASGSGWLSRALRGGSPDAVRTVLLDSSPVALAHSRPGAPGAPRPAACRGDARALPFGARSFDAAVCTGFLHHLEPDELPGFLRELDRVCRLGWWAEDLLRSRPLWLLSVSATRLASRNPLTRHDGPLSVRRAYTAAELRRAAEASGLLGVRVERCGPASAAVWRLGPPPDGVYCRPEPEARGEDS